MEKKKLQFKKNDEIVITIEDLGKDGEGIGHVDGYALFVKGALPGEKVLVHLMKLNKNYGFARLVEILEPSKERMTPFCIFVWRLYVAAFFLRRPACLQGKESTRLSGKTRRCGFIFCHMASDFRNDGRK